MIKLYNFLLNNFQNYKKIYLFLIIFILLSFFIFDNVFAFTVNDYDSRLSLFDGKENSIPPCNYDYSIVTSKGTWSCSNGTIPNIKTLVDYLPNIIRVNYHINDYDYYIYLFYDDSSLKFLIKNSVFGSNTYYYLNKPDFIISMLPKGVNEYENSSQKEWSRNFYLGLMETDSDGNIYYNYNVFNGDYPTYSPNTSSSIPLSFSSYFPGSYHDISNPSLYFRINNLSEKYSMTFDSNFVIESNVFLPNYVSGHEFKTDIDITIPKDNYVLLVPKKTEEFSSYLWTDNNFAYEEMYYDSINSTYSNVTGGGLNEINFGSLGGFNWLRWDFSFTDIDLSFKKVLMIYNHGSIDLHIKIFSSDFYYKLMSSNSSEFCVGDLCYKNDYDEFKTFAYSTGTINNKFDTTDYTDGLIYIRNLPNIIKDFSSCFTFIGVLFLNFLNIIDGSILNYFYIVFGITMIVLIIKILK